MSKLSNKALLLGIAVYSLTLCGCKDDAQDNIPTTAKPVEMAEPLSQDFSFQMPDIAGTDWHAVKLDYYPEGTRDLHLEGVDKGRDYVFISRTENRGRQRVALSDPTKLMWNEAGKEVVVYGQSGHVREIEIRLGNQTLSVRRSDDSSLYLRHNSEDIALPDSGYEELYNSSQNAVAAWEEMLQKTADRYNNLDAWKNRPDVPFRKTPGVLAMMGDYQKLNASWKNYGKDYASWFGFNDSHRLLDAFVKELVTRDLTNFSISRNPETNTVHVNWEDRINKTELRINMSTNACGLFADYYLSGYLNEYVKAIMSYEYRYNSAQESVKLPRTLLVDYFIAQSKDRKSMNPTFMHDYFDRRSERKDSLYLINANCDDGTQKINRVLKPNHFKIMDSYLQALIKSWDSRQPAKTQDSSARGQRTSESTPRLNGGGYFCQYG